MLALLLAGAGALSTSADTAAVAAWDAYVNDTIASAKHGLQEACVPRRFPAAATVPYRGTAVLFHGFSACPQQYFALAPLLAERGFDVLLPLTPGHGNALNTTGTPATISNCIYGCDHAAQLDDATGLPATTAGYHDFVARMNGIASLAAGERVVGGLSLGGALAASAQRIGFPLYARALVMNPLLQLSTKLEDDALVAIDALNGTMRRKYAGWGHECTRERWAGRGGLCMFRVEQAAAARDFGFEELLLAHAPAASSEALAVVYDAQDNTVRNNATRALARRSKAQQHCVFNFSQHSFLSTYDDLGVNKWWLNEVSCRIADYLSDGKPFPLSPRADAGEGGERYCALQCSAARCPLNMSDVHAPLRCPYTPPPPAPSPPSVHPDNPADPPVYPRAPFVDCGSTGFNITAAYFQQLSASKMINGFDATATRDFTNATFSVSVQYPGKKPMVHSFGVCTVARFHIDGFPPCPWQPGTKLHIIDHNPAHRDGPADYESTWKMVDSEGEALFCMKTNWTLKL
eukprot:g4393.t1